jgi:ubiquinone/menaquinone biosynthesis C-methylase UbiE
MDPLEKPPRGVLANFDPVAEIYDDTREKLSPRELGALTNELQGSTTLEIAVGTGRLAKPLQDLGIEISGLDVSSRMLSRAKAKGTASLARGEVTHLPFKDQAFDNVLAVHFLHLVPDWPKLLTEVARVARHGLVSIDTRTTSNNRRPREIYMERLEKRGFRPPVRLPGELLLAEKVKPHKMELIERGVENANMNKMLDMLEKKWLAVTWTVPDKLHREVMDELRRELVEKTVDYTYENFLLVWRVDDLSEKIEYL